MSPSKKFTCKGTLRQVFIWVYRLEIQSVMLYFWPSIVNCCPCHLSLSQLYPFCLFPVWKSILYTFQCVRGRGVYVVLDLRQMNTCCKITLQVNLFRWRHFALPNYVSYLSTIGPFTSDHYIVPRTNDPNNNAQKVPARISWNLQGTSYVQCYFVMVCIFFSKKLGCFWTQNINLPELSRNPPFSLRLALIQNDIHFKGLSHEIDLKKFDKYVHNLA